MIKKDKPKFNVADFQMKVFREDEVMDLRTLDTNVIMEELERNIEMRDTPIEKRFKNKKIETIK